MEPILKECSSCQELKELNCFHKDKASKCGRVSRCKNCISEYQKNRYTQKREELLKYQKEYAKQNRKKKLEYLRNYWEKCGRDKSKERREYFREWKKQNPDKHCAAQSRRRARKLNAQPDWLSTEQLREIDLMYLLARKLELETGRKYHVDHIHPLRGKNSCGLHVPWNLQVIEARQNLSKSNNLIQLMGLTAA